ncbi:MAG TPA: hypothetical protein VGO34_11645 [Alphaproteobacteria bacterium]|jgi:TPR repeat protein
MSLFTRFPAPRWCRALLLAGLFALPALDSLPAQAQTTEQEKLDAAQKAFDAKNYTSAFYLWLSLAQGGNRAACFNIGRMYVYGTGAPVDYIEAYKWMQLSAEADLPEARAARAQLASRMSAVDIKTAMDRAKEWKADNGR